MLMLMLSSSTMTVAVTPANRRSRLAAIVGRQLSFDDDHLPTEAAD